MADEKIRMGRGNNEEIQGHTIVGGRPSGKSEPGKGVPRGMEILIKKASVDSAFEGQLLQQRSKIAGSIGLNLDPSEQLMLDSIPENQLRTIIRQIQVPSAQKKVFLGTSAAAMIALLTQLTFTPVAGRAETGGQNQLIDGQRFAQSPNYEGGSRPEYPMPPGGCRGDEPEPIRKPINPQEEELMSRTVHAKVNGLLFLEAIQAIQQDLNIKINVEVPSGMKVSWTVKEDIDGKSLRESLKEICRDGEFTGFAPQFFFDSKTISIRFSPGVEPQEIQPLEPSRPPDAVTRGIRPDAVTKGSRPDYPYSAGIRADDIPGRKDISPPENEPGNGSGSDSKK